MTNNSTSMKDMVLATDLEKELWKIHPYKLYQAKDGRWKTTLRRGNNRTKLQTIAKGSKDDLVNYLLEFYLLAETDDSHKLKLSNKLTLKELFKHWIYYKKSFISSGTCRRIMSDWKRFYLDNPISNKKIVEIDCIFLTKWLNETIKEYNLTSKAYYNMHCILNGIFEYCCLPEINILTVNPLNRVKVNPRFFKKQSRKKSEQEVFMNDEKEILITYLLDKFYTGKFKTTTPLMIILNFMLGLRIGELCALKWSDIDQTEKYIWIQRMEIEDYDIDFQKNIYKRSSIRVVERTKTDAGLRKIYLSEDARKIIKMVKEFNAIRNWYDDDYIFLNMRSHTRTTTKALNSYLRDACRKAGISYKSSHKIRKSFISWAYDSGVHADTIRKLAGHESIKTTLNHYIYDQRMDQETEKLLEHSVTPALETLLL